MVEEGSLTREQGKSAQRTILDKMNSLRKQQTLLELFWLDTEGPAFLNCNEHIFEGLSEFKSSQKHQARIMMSFAAFKRLLAQHPIEQDLLQQKGWLVLQFDNFEEKVQVGSGQQVTCEALKGKTFVIDAWDAYGLFEFQPVPERTLSFVERRLSSEVASLRLASAVSEDVSSRVEDIFCLKMRRSRSGSFPLLFTRIQPQRLRC